MSSNSSSAQILGPRSLPTTQVSPPSSSLVAKYRGATVEDLQLPPAVCVPRSTTIASALKTALDHDYSQLPLLSEKNRKLLGYVDVARLEAKLADAKGEETVGTIMTKFSSSGSAGSTYTVIQPDTGLAELEVFLQTNPFAFVTDPNRAFVLGVATQEDLAKYVSRRGLDATRSGAATPTATTANPSDPSNVGAEAAAAGGLAQQSALGAGLGGIPQLMSRREEEEARKDRTLAEFLRMLDNYTPLIPDEVTDYYLEKVGFECEDVRLKRLLSLAAEKFVSDIAADAFQYARIRTNAGPGGRPKAQASNPAGTGTGAGGAGGAGGGAGAGAGGRDRSRTVLTMDDLSAALGEYGINAKRAEYYR
ncbi:hypothetical protein IE53DRAFT_385685 [Violaceomyces palustris]|uniref:Uncharacterized protein n=1 Tax=Violaceomyces palustris TaxID=1673888 RepID=A0ACD0P1A9_9BASI|nr:hypothetical protein IE53DRAFT_385685 [Violaceomyces palustris]